MRNLVINRLQYRIQTGSGKNYGADIIFKTGLNIIYGPNSLGKTSIITGIVYGLGAEKSLGIFRNDQNPFKPEIYDRIEGEKITRSYVLLEISNRKETVTLARSIINKTDVTGLSKCTIDDFDQTIEREYFVASGEGVTQEGGLQYFLFDFLGMEMVAVPTYEEKLSKLYLENLAPLFFVEQRAGWSQIQARQVTRYGIREVKKVAFEYLMGLDRFDAHILEIQKKEIQEKLRTLKSHLLDKEEELIVMANSNKVDSLLIVDYPNIGKISIYELITILKDRYELEIKSLDSQRNENGEVQNRESQTIRDSLRRNESLLRKTGNKVNALKLEIAGYEDYVNRIQINKFKNKQLKKIEGLTLDLNLNACPVCEAPLETEEEGHCKLCHSHLKRNISTPDQNLEFLEDEEKSFKEVIVNKQLELRKERANFQKYKERQESLETSLEHHLKTYAGAELASIRDRISELDSLNNEIKRYNWILKKWTDLDEFREEIQNLEVKKEALDKELSNYLYSQRDLKILSEIEGFFKKNVSALDLFRKNDALINQIKIDEHDNYTPYLESYDIYNIVSSSDNVRIMLSYYMSLLQTSISLKSYDKIKFPNLLILDEPKQQNLDNESLFIFIDLLSEISADKCQVILTTYTQVKEQKDQIDPFIIHEMTGTNDYLIKKLD